MAAAELKDQFDNFDREVIAQINKKQAIEAMSGLYNQVPTAIIEQFYDFCQDDRFKDYNEYIFLQSRYNDLTASELKRYYKLHNRMIKQFQNMPVHEKYKPNQCIEESISVIENRPIEPPKCEFIPTPNRFTEVEEEVPLVPLISGKVY